MRRSDTVIRWKYKFIHWSYWMIGKERGTVMDRMLEYKISPPLWSAAMEEAVSEWHVSDTKLGICDFLGLTWEEYRLWVEKPNRLYEIVRSRKRGNTNSGSVNTADD